MNPLRVGFFTECYRPIVNGVVASVDALADGLRERHHEVYCFAPKVPGYAEGPGAIFRMPSLPLPTKTPYRLTLPFVSRRNLNGIIKRLSIIHAHSPFVTGWMSVRYARRFEIPLVYTYHTQLEQYAHYVPFDARTTQKAAASITRLYANAADAVVVPTGAMADRLRELGVVSRIEVVPTGIDLDLFAAGSRRTEVRGALGAAGNERLALTVLRLAKEKNIELLIAAIAATKDRATRIAIVGGGPDRGSLEAHARKLGVAERVRFLGEVERTRLPDMYASADVFVFPSVTETQGIVLAEALAAGCPIIAVDAPQTREVLGAQAIYVANDGGALASALDDLQGAPATGHRLALKDAARRFSIDLQIERILSLYGDLLERQPATI